MKKISVEFRTLLTRNPKNIFPVVVTTTKKIDGKRLGLSQIGDFESIYSGSLLSKQIFDLEKILEIIAIEPDSEMKAIKK